MAFLLGLDGGGTATRITVADRDGRVLARHTAGPLNVNGQSPEQFSATVADILRWLGQAGFRPEDCAGVGIGAAGVSNPQARQLLAQAFAAGGYRAALRTYSDGDTALAAAFPDCRGIILIAGTGSLCLGRRADGQTVRAGGYGHLIDDGGSAYAIAVAIFAAVVRAEDGRAAPTALRGLVLEHLGLSGLEEMIGYLYAPARSKREIASAAVVLEPAMAAHDEAALEIGRRSAGELSLLAQTVMARMPEENGIALTGSVLVKNRSIREQLCRLILSRRPDARIVPEGRDASEGAVRLLRRDLAG